MMRILLRAWYGTPLGRMTERRNHGQDTGQRRRSEEIEVEWERANADNDNAIISLSQTIRRHRDQI